MTQPLNSSAFMRLTRLRVVRLSHGDLVNGILNPMPIGYDEMDLSWIVGRVLVDVSFHSPNLWCFSFSPTENITVECLWRLIQEGKIFRTSHDHGQLFGLDAPVDAARNAIEVLTGVVITNAHIHEATADIQIAFGTEKCLEIIADSSGYENWQLSAPNGRCYVAQGGGQLCTWTK